MRDLALVSTTINLGRRYEHGKVTIDARPRVGLDNMHKSSSNTLRRVTIDARPRVGLDVKNFGMRPGSRSKLRSMRDLALVSTCPTLVVLASWRLLRSMRDLALVSTSRKRSPRASTPMVTIDARPRVGLDSNRRRSQPMRDCVTIDARPRVGLDSTTSTGTRNVVTWSRLRSMRDLALVSTPR